MKQIILQGAGNAELSSKNRKGLQKFEETAERIHAFKYRMLPWRFFDPRNGLKMPQALQKEGLRPNFTNDTN
ncbi:MAG: hypothetical protein ACP5U1_01025 [Desulfomonilaceae bacterium]